MEGATAVHYDEPAAWAPAKVDIGNGQIDFRR
jgi:hypothetical protein